MAGDTVIITKYSNADRPDLLRLLIELQHIYFRQNALPQLQELQQEVDVKKSYNDYIDFLERNNGGDWIVYLAKAGNKITGFIIGSIELDEHLVLGKIGKFEDWYIEPLYRRQGIGAKLYDELEKWFKEKGCQQVQSDTWEGNRLSVKAHIQAGFFVSGIQFRKKI